MTNATEPTLSPDFGFGEEETLLRDQARKLLRENAGPAALRKLVARDPDAIYIRGELPPYDVELFRRCVELGWLSLVVPEANGGVGAKMVGVAALVEEMGRHVLASPCLSTLIGGCVLRSAGTSQAGRWLASVANGATLALAVTGRRGSWDLDQCDVIAQARQGAVVLNGGAFFVQDAFKVGAYLVAARSAEGIVLAMVDKNAPGLSLHRDHILDLTRDQGHLVFADVAVAASDVIAPASRGLETLRRAWPSVLTLTSADLVGTSEWLLATTVEYAKVRKQFDRSLGFFQAVKHPLVDAMMEIDGARSLVYGAGCAIDAEHGDAEVAARMAKSAASDAARFVSGRAVQLHGGIGFTWECDVHFFFKRNQHNQALYGDGVHQRKKLADLLIGPVQPAR